MEILNNILMSLLYTIAILFLIIIIRIMIITTSEQIKREKIYKLKLKKMCEFMETLEKEQFKEKSKNKHKNSINNSKEQIEKQAEKEEK